MKRSHKLTFRLAIASLFVLLLADIAACWNNPPMPPIRPPSVGPVPCPPLGYGPAVSWAPPSRGPQKCRTNSQGLAPNLICFDKGCGRVNPPFCLTAQIGYTHFGLNFAMQPPTIESNPNTPINISFPTALKLTLPGANVPMGSIEAKAESCSGFFLVVRIQGNAPKDVAAETPEAPVGDMTNFQTRSAPNFVSPRSWDDAKFQWWTIDTDLGYRVTPFWSLFLGIRREKLSVTLLNPRDSSRQLFNYEVNVPNIVYLNRTVQLDFSSELWIPYVGIEFTGRRYRACVLWGPSAWTTMKIPYSDVFSLAVRPQNHTYSLLFSFNYDYECKSLKSANLVEYSFEYDLNTSSRFAVQLWTRGNWAQLSWRGGLNEVFGLNQEAVNRPLPGVNSPHHSNTDTATYSKWMISGGIAAVLSF